MNRSRPSVFFSVFFLLFLSLNVFLAVFFESMKIDFSAICCTWGLQLEALPKTEYDMCLRLHSCLLVPLRKFFLSTNVFHSFFNVFLGSTNPSRPVLRFFLPNCFGFFCHCRSFLLGFSNLWKYFCLQCDILGGLQSETFPKICDSDICLRVFSRVSKTAKFVRITWEPTNYNLLKSCVFFVPVFFLSCIFE